jgi:RimJ/RimL family protein N-acetyltransferase
LAANPILIDLPDVIHTEHLTIRPPRSGDGQKIYEAVVESLEALRAFPAFMSWALEEPSVEATETFARSSMSNFIARREFPWLFLMRETETLIGCGGIHNPRWAAGAFEIGWWGRTSFTGKGLMSEAVGGVLNFALSSLNANRVAALTDDLNTKSCRLCERVGMQLEGVLRNERIAPDGTLRNTRLYSKIR